MNLAGLPIKGASVGSYGTCIMLPSIGVAFDMGRCSEKAVGVGTVLISHGHMDHIGGAGHHIARRELMKLPPPNYVMSAEIVEPFEKLMEGYRELNGSPMPHQLFGLPPEGGVYASLGKGRYVDALPSYHVLPSLAYVIWSSKSKLRPDLAGKSPAEIRSLARQGEEVSVVEKFPEVAFTGDTTIQILDHEDIRKAKVLIMELTFIDDSVSPEKAARWGHVHIQDVIDNADRFENQFVVFTHFSMRYSPSQIKSTIREKLPENLRDRTRLLIDPIDG